jgi:hypothetical protein
MSLLSRSPFLSILMAFALFSCDSHVDSNTTSQVKVVDVPNQPTPSDYQEFSTKFNLQTLPLALPFKSAEDKQQELDKKFIKSVLNGTITPAFGTEDILPGLSDNIDAAKYYACAKVKLDSFSGYIVHKAGEDDYYFLCLFDKTGKYTDGMCVAFTEGTDADGTIREAAVNDDGSIEISQHNIVKGKPEREGAERHFYEITNDGKIRDLKSNAEPSHA